jgi:hypothetical protein
MTFPCPICGGEPIECEEYNSHIWIVCPECEEDCRPQWEICPNCETRLPIYIAYQIIRPNEGRELEQ